ncbi:enoyl-CoA hydratase/isomerase family protein [Mesorhizobium australicum]|uniref:enoyl-CoA hydratase/isomerase family protein n=1 Tax=Mesorhizobium australicum TaxID=536018 RepID=UPI00333542F1
MVEFLHVWKEGPVGIVVLNRPENLNAWHEAMRKELANTLRAFDQDDEVRAIILTGAGARAFSAGQDLNEAKVFDEIRAGDWIEEWRNLYGTMRNISKPLIAALNGVAAGSAFQVALLCDIRVGHEGSRMGQPEINSGITSTLGPWIMNEMLGMSRTIELTLTGRLMDGTEAHRIGLIHYLVDKDRVMAKAREVAEQLAAKPPIAMKLNKRRFAEMTERTFDDALQAGLTAQRESYASGEPQRYMQAFFAERRSRAAGATA